MTPNPLADGRRDAKRIIALSDARMLAQRERNRQIRQQRLAEILNEAREQRPKEHT